MKIDVRLIPLKILYFIQLAGIASLVLYLSPFLSSRGLNNYEIAVTAFVSSLAGFFSRPLVGALADKLQRFKEVIIVMCLLSAISFSLLLFLPTAEEGIISYSAHVSFLGANSSESNLINVCVKSSLLPECWPQTLDQCSLQSRQFNLTIADSYSSLCATYMVTGATVAPSNSSINLICNTLSRLNDTICIKDLFTPIRKSWSTTFWLAVLFRVAGYMCYTPVLSLSDAVTFNLLGNHPEKFGHTRVYGSLGFFVFAMVSGFALYNASSVLSRTSNYMPSFIIYALLSVVGAGSAACLRIPGELRCKSNMKSLGLLCITPQVASFCMVAFVCGMCLSILENYVFLAVGEMLHPPHYFFGLMCVFMEAGEAPVLAVSGWIIKKLGEPFCMVLVLLAWALRFFGYSVTYNYWIILPIELLQGLCCGLMFAAINTYASRVAPKGTEGAMQGLASGISIGLGVAIGSLLGGVIRANFNDRAFFQICAGFSLASAILYGAVYKGLLFCNHPIYTVDDNPVELVIVGEDKLSGAVEETKMLKHSDPKVEHEENENYDVEVKLVNKKVPV